MEPITKQQWLTAIRSNPNYEFDIGLERSDYDYAELLDVGVDGNGDDLWPHFEDSGTLTAEHRTALFLYHTLFLATELKAKVIGEESEVYEFFGNDFQSRLAYQNEIRVNHWLRIETENGFNFRSEADDENT